MISAPPGLSVRYATEGRGDICRPVLAFDDDGLPLVLNDRGQLVPAGTWSNFIEVDTHRSDRGVEVALVTSVMPAPGWHVRFADGSTEPLVGWGVTNIGTVVPIHVVEGCYAEMLDTVNADARIFHELEPIEELTR